MSARAGDAPNAYWPLPAPLTDTEAFGLTTTKLRLMHSECGAENDLGRQHLKRLVTEEHLRRAVAQWSDSADGKDRRPREEAEWRDFVNDPQSVFTTWSDLESRERALLFLLELVSFSPWGPKGSARFLTDRAAAQRRRHALTEVSANVGGLLEAEDALNLDERLRKTVRRLSRLPFDTAKAVTVSLGGALAGAATGGLAAPAVGGLIGNAMGLGGAAATNAGLALLGGGSIASGGFGMAGGAAVVAGALGAAGGVAVAAGQKAVDHAAIGKTYVRDVTADDLLGDTAKLVVTVEVILCPNGQDPERLDAILEALRDQRYIVEEELEQLGGPKRFSPQPDGVTRKYFILGAAIDRLQRLQD